MKRLLIILILVFSFSAHKAFAAVAFVVASSAGCSGNCTATTASIDTSGSSLCVTATPVFSVNPTAGTMSDSKGNSWHSLTVQDDSTGGGMESVLWYAWDHGGTAFSAGSGHTFSIQSTSYPGISVICFSGTDQSADPFDQQNGAKVTNGATTQPGSITPTANGEAIFTSTVELVAGDSTYSIDSSFVRPAAAETNYNTNVNLASAYLIQGTAAAVNPTWTIDSAPKHITLIASFKAATGGGGGGATPLSDDGQWFPLFE